MKNLTVLDTGKIDGGAFRWVKLADGSWRVEEWRGDKWVPGGASFAEIADSPPVGPEFAAELGIPMSDLGSRAVSELCAHGHKWLSYRGELVSCPAALPRFLLRKLTCKTVHAEPRVLAGPCVPGFHGDVARVIERPGGGWRIERWVKGAGWTAAPEGSIPLADFIPGFCRPVLEKDAIRLGCYLEDFGRHWTEEPGHPWDRAKIVHALKERAFDLAANSVTPGHA
jgi:hypothetical protein